MSLEEILSMAQLSAWSGYSIQTLYDMRARGEGPASFKMGSGRGSRVRYRRSAVEEWLRQLEAAEQERLNRLHQIAG
jgi:predicted DNA-binding transcriptional regulator AlpA